ncbi:MULTISPECIES: hypothetical protein [Microbulbifer]|uniref:hypothetical protein n=1 Tax=Microbulbifer TaxID=48073 RepID=UPI0011439533|nr:MULTISPECIES: hypothetical protein [Microbulbifer]
MDEEIYEVKKRDQAASRHEPRKQTNDFAELGLLMDAAVLKTVLMPDGPKEGNRVDVPTYCYHPFKQVCSAKENICTCEHDGEAVIGVRQEEGSTLPK